MTGSNKQIQNNKQNKQANADGTLMAYLLNDMGKSLFDLLFSKLIRNNVHYRVVDYRDE